MYISGVCISPGSVATQRRCGGIFNNELTANFPHFEKSVNIWQKISAQKCAAKRFVAPCSAASAMSSQTYWLLAAQTQRMLGFVLYMIRLYLPNARQQSAEL